MFTMKNVVALYVNLITPNQQLALLTIIRITNNSELN